MKGKYLFATIVTLMISFSLISCSNSTNPKQEEPPPDQSQKLGELKFVSTANGKATLIRVNVVSVRPIIIEKLNEKIVLNPNDTATVKSGYFKRISTRTDGRITVLDLEPLVTWNSAVSNEPNISYVYKVNPGKSTTITEDFDPEADSVDPNFQGKECRLIYNNRPSGEASTVSYKEGDGKLIVNVYCSGLSSWYPVGHNNKLKAFENPLEDGSATYTQDPKDSSLWILKVTRVDKKDNQVYTDTCHCR